MGRLCCLLCYLARFSHLSCVLLLLMVDRSVAQEVPPIGVGAVDVSAYSQANRAQSVNRDVSFRVPPVIEPGATGTSVDLSVIESVNSFNDIQLRHRSYNGDLTGPTIRVNAGQTLRVHLCNLLDPEPPGDHFANQPHGFNTTNLHTHGLHVSPKSPADDVFREVAPGEEFDYEFSLPPDHPPGTYWYHAHKHGSTALQLASGMSGALIVNGGLDTVPAIANAAEKVMVLQQFVYQEVQGEPAYVDPELVYRGDGDLVEAVNGVVTPTIVMRPGEVQRWRIIHAGTSEAIFLDIEGINFYEIAVDGLATGKLTQKDALELYPGYRSDVLVKAPLRDGTRLMSSRIASATESIRGRSSETRNLLRVVVAGDPKPMPLPTVAELEPFAAFTDEDVPSDDEIVRQREIRFRIEGDQFLVNGVPFDPESITQTIQLGTAEEWKIVSENGVHPFHIHVNPFAVRREGTNEPWVWRDTIAVLRRRPMILRTRYTHFDGKSVLHCHNLDHEDKGMMQAIEIVNEEPGESPGSVSRERATTDAVPAKSLPTAPQWTAVDMQGNERSDANYQGRPLLLVFHRGMSCIHCAEQLALLDRHVDRFQKAGISLVAISQSLPEDAESLQTLADFQYPILVDEPLESFAKFSCIADDGVPHHGLFLINGTNHIVFEEQSEIAETDPERLVDRMIKFHLLHLGD